ncbi:E3 ubiquitin-protein ligase RNF4 [Pteropus alecto]|uniref:E3 ubiquitin-protein ligase RNF4 n=1 Tax=Pteropus alecto TaxID=9402 RepID=UPI000D53AD91|nr:E3 ubiquitin-protein ligase RNF4 [Pteropus alecto]
MPQERKWLAIEAVASCWRASPQQLPKVHPSSSAAAAAPAGPAALQELTTLAVCLPPRGWVSSGRERLGTPGILQTVAQVTSSSRSQPRSTMSTRKRRGGTLSSRQAQKRTREAASTPEMALEAEPIELVESAGDEIVDLTCESLEPVVVDLTHNDSVVIVDERRRPRRTARRLRQDHADSCVVSSDDEELARDRDVYVTTHTPRNTREEAATGLRPSGTVSCPICMDGYSEIVQNGRLIVSTECGHVFCSQCLRDSLKNANTCPTCRKKINHKRYHPIYI